ncbi:hypothetical protein QBC46DRAFT_435241 [Diplogelasinospora grovesii]|uniref:Uncharacterized protein n=1 Tax=Diplogelasinospora grovesii TaxID=303347 RepID=A0AAN6N6V1_9PEZI|nr:hypothetical protein QBC46DRAFT_435241 [Diplogelasinospora grovesii]
MALNILPVEILSLILQAVDRPRDLLSLIIASAPCYGTYKLSPHLILSSVVRNAILPDALPHALAAIYVPVSNPPQVEPLETFLDEYFQTPSSPFPPDMAGLVSLCNLYSRVSYFIDDYSSRAMRALVTQPNTERNPSFSPLSPTERARFQRAFFRYEIYSLALPADFNAHRNSLFSAHMQFTHFLHRMEPWEVEEMSCVYHYFASLIGGFIDHLEDQVAGSPFVPRPPQAQKKSHIDSRRVYGRYDCAFFKARPGWGQSGFDDEDMVLVDYLDLTDLALFSKDGRYRIPRNISYLASLGSTFLYQLVLADDHRRKDMIRENSPNERHFLPEAIDEALAVRRLLPRTIMPDEVRDELTHPNLGYHLFKRSDWDVYLPIIRGKENYRLRERAYVFWDAGRISSPAATYNLREARDVGSDRLNQLLDREGRKSPEERLEGVSIPKTQMEKIEHEFGSLEECF